MANYLYVLFAQTILVAVMWKTHHIGCLCEKATRVIKNTLCTGIFYTDGHLSVTLPLIYNVQRCIDKYLHKGSPEIITEEAHDLDVIAGTI